MAKQHRWLRAEIERWRAEGLIDPGLAATLTERYPLAEERAWGRLIFSAIGAVLIGLGVILFFAYNWEDLPKFVKLGLVAVALAASHGAALWLAREPTRPRSMIEGLHILGTMLFGAGIWLVAQVYHIDEHYPNAILVWGLGALALAWTLPSLAQAFLALALVVFWSGVELFEYQWGSHWAPLLVGAGVLPLAWTERSRTLLFFALAAFLGVLILAAVPLEDELAFSLATFTAVFYVALGLLADRSDFPASAWVLKAVGFAGYFALLYIYSFAEAVEVLDDLSLAKPAVQAYFWVSLLLAALAWLATPVLGLRRLSVYWQWHWGLLAVPLVVVAAVSLEILPLTDWVAAIPFNLVILGHCIVFILQGTRAGDVKLVSIACVLFTALIFARYVDLFESLLLRSAIFLALGAGIFVVGNFYNRSKRWLEGTAG